MGSLATQLQRWVDDGLISQDQAAAIAAAEHRRDDGDGRGVSRLAEALGYVGAALALAAGALFLSEVWAQLTDGVRVVLLAAITGGTILGGAALRRASEAAFVRLATVLWAVSVVGVAMTAVVAGDQVLDLDERFLPAFTSLPATAVAFALWRTHASVLQHLAAYLGLVASIASVIVLADVALSSWYWGMIVYGIGLAWGALAWSRVVVPATVGLVAAILTLGVGIEMLAGGAGRLPGLFIGVGTAVALVALGVIERRTLLLGSGTLGVAVFVPRVIWSAFEGSVAAPLALFATGLALVGGAVGIVRLRRHTDSDVDGSVRS